MKTNKLAQRRRRLSLTSKESRRRRLRVECLEQRRLLAANLAPENIVPDSGSVLINQPLAFTEYRGNLINVSDPDAGDSPVQVTLEAANGTVSLVTPNPSGTLTYVTGDGTDDALFTLQGSITAINEALSWVVFEPATDYLGTEASITITTDDLGNTGDGGALTDVDVIPVNVNDLVLDAPVKWETNAASFDDAFGESGVKRYPALGALQLMSSERTTDGGIILGGTRDDRAIIIKFDSQYNIDTSFGDQGIVEFASEELISVIRQDNTGRIYLSSHTISHSNGSKLIRLTASGQLDNSFGTDGFASVNAWIRDFHFRADGQLELWGARFSANPYLWVSRYSIDGVRDISVDEIFYGYPSKIRSATFIPLDDGRSVGVGGGYDHPLPYIASVFSVNATGQDVEEWVYYSNNNPSGYWRALDNTIRQTILVAGNAYEDGVRRSRLKEIDALAETPEFKSDFGNGNGVVFQDVNSIYQSAGIQDDGRLLISVVAPDAESGGTKNQLIRLKSNGEPDQDFNAGAPVDLPGFSPYPHYLDDGRILLVGTDTYGAAGTLQVVMLQGDTPIEYDYGDAPAPYPVTFEEDGARHGERPVEDTLWQSFSSDPNSESLDLGINYAAGMDLSYDGRTMVVADHISTGVYEVSVFSRDVNDVWQQVGQTITDDQIPNIGDGADYPQMTVSISGDGNRMAFKRLSNDSPTLVYEYRDEQWMLLGGAIPFGGLKVELSADGNSIVIGNGDDSTNGDFAGAVAVFALVSDEWQQQGETFYGSQGGIYQGHGSLSADGKTLAVLNLNSVSIYKLENSSWVQVGAAIQTEAAGDLISTVSLSHAGDRVAIGARENDGGASNAGHARVFEFNGSDWIQIGSDIDGEAENDLGGWVELTADGNRLLQSFPRSDTFGTDVGKVVVYDLREGDWQQVGQQLAGFERSPNISGDGSVIGFGVVGVNVFKAVTSPQLGPTRTLEANGIHSDLADADADDGVTFGELRVGQTDGTVTVNVQNAPLGAKLDAWIDFNGDGNWGGPQEQIFDSVDVVNGDNQLQFRIPGFSISGDAYARFRLSTGGDLGIGGEAVDGEVEDYAIQIETSAPGSFTEASKRIIDSQYSWVTSVRAIDLDQDGDQDILMTDLDQSILAWYEQTTPWIFERHVIAIGTLNQHSKQQVEPIDIDGDGDIDLVVADWRFASGLKIYLNDGAENFSVKQVSSDPISFIQLVDLDSDGDTDVVYTMYDADKIGWYENLGELNFAKHDILGSYDWPRAIEPGDFDRDGDLDFILAVRGFNTGNGGLYFLENDGNANFTETFFDAGEYWDAGSVDLNRDGFLDFYFRKNGGQGWYNNNGDNTFSPTLIAPAYSTLSPFDANSDGFMDFYAVTWEPSTVGTLLNTGGGWSFTPAFSIQEDRLNVRHFPDTEIIDFDGDGDVDIVAVYENLLFISENNAYPTLNEIAGVSVDEDVSEQVVGLNGITAGGAEVQPLQVTATSSDPNLIPDPTVTYTSADETGSLSFTPVPDAFGTATITVTVEDGGLDLDLATAADNATFIRTFDVTVDAVNDTPTIDSIANLTIDEDNGEQVVSLSGIADPDGYVPSSAATQWNVADGGNGHWYELVSSPILVWNDARVDAENRGGYLATLTSENENAFASLLIPDNAALVGGYQDTASSDYSEPAGGWQWVTGEEWSFTNWGATDPSNGGVGPENVLELNSFNTASPTAAANWNDISEVTPKTFLVEYSTPLRVTATSADPSLIANLAVTFTNHTPNGSLSFEPVQDAFGKATITVKVEDAGLDGDLSTPADNAIITRSFDVTVNAVNDAPVLATLPEIVLDEDTVIHGTGTNLNLFASDIDSDESKLEFKIVNLAEIDPQFGLSIGMDPQSDSFALRADDTIHVHPAGNFFGSTQVVIEARDPEGDVSNQQTFNLVINPVNDPPVLDPSAELALTDVLEDSGSPVGQVGSLVSTLIDENGPLSNYSDIDGIAPGIAVVGKNIAIEKIWFSTDDGQNWQEAGSVSDAEALVLDADETTRIYLQTTDDFSGDLADALIIKAWDQTGGYSIGQVGVDSSAIAFSSQTDTVSISVEPSPSSAADDFYLPQFDGVETFVISKADLLANDMLGNGESIDTITITADATSAAGGAITVDGDQFTYTRPANWFSGIDAFGYTLDDGGSTSHATVTILSGLQGETLTITLEPGRDHDVTLRTIDDVLVMLDHVTQATLLNIPRELMPANVDVIGAPANSNTVTFSELSGSEPSESSASWSYQGGTANDELAVLGSGSQWAWLSSDPQTENDVTVELKLFTTLIDSYTMIAVEKVSIGQVDRVEFSDPYLQVGTQTFDLVSTKPVNLPTDVTISEGILQSSTPIGLHTAKSLVGSGQVDATFGGGVSSLIRATGDLVVGNASNSDGFRTDGRVEVGTNTVTLLDKNQASLGELTTLGDGVSPGTLVSDHGLAISFTGNVEGYGTIQTNADGTVINNGNIIGNSSEQPITINSRVKGVGTFDNVVMNGEFTPGFSPTLWKSGTVAYTDLNRFVIELGGRLAGAEFDRVEHYLAKLGGTLDVQLIDGFKPLLGDLFEVITSEQPFEGDFSEILLPLQDNGARIRELLGQHGIELETVFDVADTLEVLKSQAADYQIAGHDGSGLKVQGDRFRAFVTSLHQFVAEHPWHTEQLEVEAGKLVQIATDGVNRLMIEGSNWKNFVEPSDVNNDQNVTALDALTVINELGRRSHSDDLTSKLNDATILVTGEGHFYDQNGDGKCTALDALRVINDLARSSVSGEGEAVTADYLSGGSDGVWSLDTESYEAPFESEFEETDLIYSDADPETSNASDRPEDLVYATVGQESTEAVDSLLSDLEDWWK